MGEMLGQSRRTHMNGLVNENLIGQEITVTGWVAKRRNLGSLIFCDLRDREGILQVVFREESSKEAYEKALEAFIIDTVVPQKIPFILDVVK